MTNKNAFEVAFWPYSEEYMEDVSILDPAFELATGPDGPAGINE
jgi:hypothetical protein